MRISPRDRRRIGAACAWLALLGLSAPAGAELVLPPGFTRHLYVTGRGLDSDTSAAAPGIPSSSTLAFDSAGALYVARTGRRYSGGEIYDLWPVFRFPLGGAHVTPESEERYLHGPPLPNAQVAAVRGGREVLVTTFDRDRKIGALYRMVNGRAELFAGGTPIRGTPPLLVQPEGAAVDSAGNVYVADRERGTIVRLDPSGRVLDARHLALTRPRVLAIDDKDQLWVGSDGPADAPWQRGPGELWRVGRDGAPVLVLRGPVLAAISGGPAGHVFGADRQGGHIFVVTPDGQRIEFGRFTDGDAPRSLCFAPDTEDTRRAGIAGDLFVVTIRRGAFRVNDVIRISGPFERFVREGRSTSP